MGGPLKQSKQCLHRKTRALQLQDRETEHAPLGFDRATDQPTPRTSPPSCRTSCYPSNSAACSLIPSTAATPPAARLGLVYRHTRCNPVFPATRSPDSCSFGNTLVGLFRCLFSTLSVCGFVFDRQTHLSTCPPPLPAQSYKKYHASMQHLSNPNPKRKRKKL